MKLSDACASMSSNIAQKDISDCEGEYPIFGASGLIGNVDFYKQEKPYIGIVKDGAGVGRAYLLPGKSSVIGTMQYILPKSNADITYLYYAIQFMHLEKYYNGATIPHIYFRDYKHEPLILPELPEQQEKAQVLATIDKLISLHKMQVEMVDKLVKSRFIEMFGDPVMNSKGFPTRKGEDFFKLSNGKAVPSDKRKESGVPAYGGNGISWYTDDVLCSKDTIVVGRVGFQSGNVHYAEAPIWITDNAMYVSWYDENSYDLKFLCAMMEYINFSKFQDMGDLKKVTQKPFMEFRYICPPLQEQRQYVDFVALADKSKLAIQQSIDTLQTLKAKLMQDYFGRK